MVFWDYLTYIKLGGKWLAKLSECISETQETKGKVTFWDYLTCIGESTEVIDDKGKPQPAKRRAKPTKVNTKD